MTLYDKILVLLKKDSATSLGILKAIADEQGQSIDAVAYLQKSVETIMENTQKQEDVATEIKKLVEEGKELQFERKDGIQKTIEATANFLKSFQGNPGYTPRKHLDYFTDQEQQDFKKEITPVKGKDYWTEEEAVSILKEATPKKGSDYYTPEEAKDFIERATPIKGVHYFTKKEIQEFLNKSKGKDGVVDYSLVKKMIVEKAQNLNGKDIVELINAIKDKDAKFKIDALHIKGLKSFVSQVYGGGQITVSRTAPRSPQVNQLWYDIS